ncbi:hypothetical protein BH23VER1_BH23VER1_21530 [soil metagenome]
MGKGYTAMQNFAQLRVFVASLVIVVLGFAPPSVTAAEESKKLVLIAGKPSHPPLMHEFRAGCLLLQNYEAGYSANPIWSPRFEELPEHPSTRGVGAFQAEDEWYFAMRFSDGVAGNKPETIARGSAQLTPILVAAPSDDVRDGPYVYPKGPYDHIIAESGRAETLLWIVDRMDGGRGFGFTGGHFHLNWGNDDFRKVILNTLLWVTGVEIPEGGVESEVTDEDLRANLDDKG